MKFCTKCGKPLSEGENCSCQKDGIIEKIKSFISSIFSKTQEQINFLERNKKIVPECVRADDGETPIKQYDLAKLRSKIRGQYAEGRLQITNKRLLFRAAGVSSLGKTVVQQEFDISEISGIEIKKGNKLSILNIIGALLLSAFVSEEFRNFFETFSSKSSALASIIAVLLFIGSGVLFFFVKKLFWIKLASFSCAIGALLGSSGLSFSALDIVFGFELFTLHNVLIFILSLAWFYILLQVCFVPDLIFSVKTNSASDVVQIRRRIWGLFFKDKQEYTGFSEVLPWTDTDLVSEELGAIIHDLQTLGDLAIDKWKE